tara:strand:+ start:195 stop:407 length:213 start_codon:yes stop_codon:yes gene_type:complete
MPVPIPATIGILGYTLSLFFDKIWVFNDNHAFEGIIFNLICFNMFYAIITFIVYSIIKRKPTTPKAQPDV